MPPLPPRSSASNRSGPWPISTWSPFPSPLKTTIPTSSGSSRWRESPSKRRRGTERDPLVIGGGIAVTLNPEPLADFFDLFLIGEGEALLPDFLDAAVCPPAGTHPGGVPRPDPEGDFRGLRPPLLPGDHRSGRAHRRPGTPRRRLPPADRPALRPPTSTPSRPNRGSPPRAPNSAACSSRRSAGDAGGAAVSAPPASSAGRRVSGAPRPWRPPSGGGSKRERRSACWERPSRTTPISSPCAAPFWNKGGSVAVGSLRLDRLSGPMAALLKETGVETLSLAPEAGSQRLRDVIRKGITEEEIFSAVDNLLEYDMVQSQALLHGRPPDGDGRGCGCHHPSGQGDGTPGPPHFGREEGVPASDAQHQPVHPEARHPLPVAPPGGYGRRQAKNPADHRRPARREGGLGHPRSSEVELHPGPPRPGRPEGGKAACWRSTGSEATGRRPSGR